MSNIPTMQVAGRRRCFGTCNLRFLLLASVLGLMLLNAPAWSAGEAKPEAATPDPNKILQQACDLLKSAPQFSFKAEVTDDRVYPGGKKLQFGFDLEAFVQKPDKLRVNAAGDVENKEFFLNGKTITLFDRTKNAYAVMEVPAGIDAALDQANKDHALKVALTDLARANPCAQMKKGVKHSLYVGLHKVRGVTCHHLAFDRDDLQWQIWIDAGDKPLIRKFLINQKKLPHNPQWTATFTSWNLSPQLSDSLFVFTPPAKAVKAKFVSLKEGAAAPLKPVPAPKKKEQKGDRS